jgi:F0F1-type ATP synthase delta subunit
MKRFLDQPSTSKKQKTEDFSEFIKEIHNTRLSTAESVLEIKFNKKRIRFINKIEEVPEEKKGIAYWMGELKNILTN